MASTIGPLSINSPLLKAFGVSQPIYSLPWSLKISSAMAGAAEEHILATWSLKISSAISA